MSSKDVYSIRLHVVNKQNTRAFINYNRKIKNVRVKINIFYLQCQMFCF